MSAESFSERLPYSVEGKFYVTEMCLDCDLCRAIAPSVFIRNEDEGTSYVSKQPVTESEIEQVRESIEGCPCEAIYADGDEHDWSEPTFNQRPAWRTDGEEKPICGHCESKRRPWWKIWG